MIKELIKKYFTHFYYFFTYLRYKLLFALTLSLIVGFLDGMGLVMFIPLLQMVDGNGVVDSSNLGYLKFIVDSISLLGISLNVISVLLIILFFFLVKGIVKFFENYYKVILQKFFVRHLRDVSIDGLSKLSYKSFVNSDVGLIQNTLSGEIGRVVNAYRTYFLSMQSGIMVLVYTSLAFLSNPKFAFLVLMGGIFSNFVYLRIYKKTKESSRKLTLTNHFFQAQLIQKVAFFKYLKATGLIRRFSKRLKRIAAQIEEINRKMGFYDAVLASTREPLVILVVVSVIIIQVSFFSESLGSIILSLMFFYRSLSFIMSMQTHWNGFLNVSGSLENMKKFTLDLKNGRDLNGISKFSRLQSSIEFKNVNFAYEDGLVLSDINLKINKNETIAFVGESGSGKTTIVNVVSGLLPPTSGTLFIDNENSLNLNLEYYQNRIGYITQEPVVFSDTIYNNITFWAEKTPENIKKFWSALKQASIDEFVESLPLCEDSFLGNNGILVSGGQKQRFSIARELYKDVDILIMDEATSALDSETERIIQNSIDLLKGRLTIIIIAHRLSTIKQADRIVLLKNGAIQSIGGFDKLRETSSEFDKMVKLQEF